MLFRTKKQFFSDFRNCQHIFDKNGPMELDADEPRKFQGDFGSSRHGWGGGGRPGKILVGGGWGRGKAKILFGEEI